MVTHYTCDGCRGTLGPAGCPIHANTAGAGVVGAVLMAAADRPSTIVDELRLTLEPIRDLLRYLDRDALGHRTYKDVWEAGRQALTTLERLAGETAAHSQGAADD